MLLRDLLMTLQLEGVFCAIHWHSGISGERRDIRKENDCVLQDDTVLKF
jgi:hypothetical protein